MPKINPYPLIGKKSLFSRGVNSFEHKINNVKYTLNFITISQYCRERFITRDILRTFIKKGWVVLDKGTRSRIGVKEICTKAIDDYLNL